MRRHVMIDGEQYVAIVGSRDYAPLSDVDEVVARLPATSVVVSGGARGVDQRAVDAARRRGLCVLVLRPDWSRGRGAGLERNTALVACADRVIAFWNGRSRGTADTIAKARAAGLPLEVIGPTEPEACHGR